MSEIIDYVERHRDDLPEIYQAMLDRTELIAKEALSNPTVRQIFTNVAEQYEDVLANVFLSKDEVKLIAQQTQGEFSDHLVTLFLHRLLRRHNVASQGRSSDLKEWLGLYNRKGELSVAQLEHLYNNEHLSQVSYFGPACIKLAKHIVRTCRAEKEAARPN